jgi:hypothetical protein
MDRDALIRQFVQDFGWSQEALNDEFRIALLQLLTDLGCPRKRPDGDTPKPIRKFRAIEDDDPPLRKIEI